MSEETPLVELRGMSFGYGSELILEDIDLTIGPRDFLAIIGPNGGGKSTLLLVLLGLLEPWRGEVVVRVPRGRMGYVPQFAGFDPRFPLRVRDVVRMGRLGRRGLLHRYAADDRAAVEAMVERFGLERVADEPVGELSGGQLQRTLIARALVSDPAILLLDEPLASLDAESRRVLLDELRSLNERIPIVTVTHDLTVLGGEIKQIGCLNRRLHYHRGSVLPAGALEEVYGCPVEMIAHGIPHRVLAPHEEQPAVDHGHEH